MPEFSLLHSAVMIRPDQSMVTSGFLLQLIKGHDLQSQIGKEIQSIGVPDLGLDKINELSVSIPPLPTTQDCPHPDDGGQPDCKTEALIEKYKSIKQGMMYDLFTQSVNSDGQLRPPNEEAPQL